MYLCIYVYTCTCVEVYMCRYVRVGQFRGATREDNVDRVNGEQKVEYEEGVERLERRKMSTTLKDLYWI